MSIFYISMKKRKDIRKVDNYETDKSWLCRLLLFIRRWKVI